ncbi:hypothetical protein [Streptomyces sp. RFCAC02]|uniref:hypothetical protein n=1 Tax=Streptomyces sp. RFCAC02 TaxID=2499143 RepID=UPI001F0E39D2|nr:hypothetical protein [Streptomyces sp. RFCAC02]
MRTLTLKFSKLWGTLLGVVTIVAATTLSTATPASALSVSFTYVNGSDGGKTIHVKVSGDFVGYGQWLSYGDTLIAADSTPDGYGVEAHLSSIRTASTRGLASPIVVRETGNLPENHSYSMWVCLVKGSTSYCSDTVTAVS